MISEKSVAFSEKGGRLPRPPPACMRNTVERTGIFYCPKNGLDTKWRVQFPADIQMWWESKNKAKMGKVSGREPRVDIKITRSFEIPLPKTAWDKVFSTFSTEFSTGLAAR